MLHSKCTIGEREIELHCRKNSTAVVANVLGGMVMNGDVVTHVNGMKSLFIDC